MNGQLKIETMYAFVVVDDDGTEGVPAFNGPDGMIVPLMGADMARADSLEPIAQEAASALGKPVTLLRFTNREVVKTLQP